MRHIGGGTYNDLLMTECKTLPRYLLARLLLALAVSFAFAASKAPLYAASDAESAEITTVRAAHAEGEKSAPAALLACGIGNLHVPNLLVFVLTWRVLAVPAVRSGWQPRSSQAPPVAA